MDLNRSSALVVADPQRVGRIRRIGRILLANFFSLQNLCEGSG